MKDPFLQRLILMAFGAGLAIGGFLIKMDVLVPLGTGLIGWGMKAPGHDG